MLSGICFAVYCDVTCAVNGELKKIYGICIACSVCGNTADAVCLYRAAVDLNIRASSITSAADTCTKITTFYSYNTTVYSDI